MTSSTLEIRYAPGTGELDIAASRERLMKIAGLLDAANGRLEAVDLSDGSPFETCLLALSVHQRPSGGVTFRVAPDARELIIEGGIDSLRLLGDNLRGLAQDGSDEEHLHIEYFPDHFYLDESSFPVVVQVMANGR